MTVFGALAAGAVGGGGGAGGRGGREADAAAHSRPGLEHPQPKLQGRPGDARSPLPPTQPRRRNPQPRRAAHTAFDDYLFHECSDENTQLLNQHLSEASSPLPPATAADLQAQPPLNPPLTLSPVPTAGAAEGAALDHPSDPAGQAPRHEVDDRVAAAVLGEGERHCLSLRFCCRSVKD